MEIPTHQEAEGDIPIPLNTFHSGVVVHHQLHHHHPNYHPTPQTHLIPTSTPTNLPIPTNNPPPTITNTSNTPTLTPTLVDDHNNNSIIVPFKKMVIRYRECLKNHAATMGGNAIDGCGEFMPSGEEGTLEALTCSACHCHRNFHRKEVEGGNNNDPSICEYFHNGPHFGRMSRKVLLGHHHHQYKLGPPPHGQMMVSYNLASDDQSDDERTVPHHHHHQQQQQHHQMMMMNMKKRFRTKFTQEQKEKMFEFAEKIGWKFQKQEERVVQQFCQEIGVKRRVLKVWMHNNKHNLAKKNSIPSDTTTQNNPI